MERYSTLLLECSISTDFFQIAFSAPKTPGRHIRETNTTTTNGTGTNGTKDGNNTSNGTSSFTNAGTTVGIPSSTGTSGGKNTSSETTSGNNTSSNETPDTRNGNKSGSPTLLTLLQLLMFAFVQMSIAWN